MTRKYIIRKRQNTILYFEFILTAIASGYSSVHFLDIHPAFGLVIGIATPLIIISLFVHVRIFRYIFSFVFSAGWAALAFWFGYSIDVAIELQTGKHSQVTSWVLAVLAFAIALWAHKDHFHFIKGATVHEYERN